MDRRHLEYVLTAAECGSISAAARRLSVSQPTISAALAKLELHHGVSLLRRTARGVELTDAGRDWVGPAARVLRSFDDLDRALGARERLERGHVALVCPRTLAHDPMATIVGRFRRRHPGMHVSLTRPHGGESVASVVASGRAEVGIEAGERADDELTRVHLVRQHIDVLVPPEMRIPQEAGLAELVGHGIITTRRSGVTRRLLAERLGERLVDQAVVVETSSTGAMVPLVRAGLGVAFVPRAMAREAVATGVDVREPCPPLTREVWLTHGSTLSPAAGEFVTVAGEMYAGEKPSG